MFTSHVESAACLRAIFHLHCNANKVKELPSAEAERLHPQRAFCSRLQSIRTYTPHNTEMQRNTCVHKCVHVLIHRLACHEACACTPLCTHTQHVLCKAKMLLTVLNKTLNHLCQTEGSEKRERGEEAISLAGKMP